MCASPPWKFSISEDPTFIWGKRSSYGALKSDSDYTSNGGIELDDASEWLNENDDDNGVIVSGAAIETDGEEEISCE